ncbi:hypothetical protein ATANTOWER_016427 [Ataeniobius toweri]|uniref:Uncharacterized protein n=1 Tax=Ataeniobius toweri TaxID=208326 RepID=A0ABU7B711_9TELE|nr:hypothetical protein [Ataeniobius toweri]
MEMHIQRAEPYRAVPECPNRASVKRTFQTKENVEADAIATLIRASDVKRSPKKRLLLLFLNRSRLSRLFDLSGGSQQLLHIAITFFLY